MRPSYGHDPGGSAIVPVLVIVAAAVTAGLYHWGDLKVSKMLPAYPDKVRTVDSIQTDHVKKLERKVASLTKRLEEAAPDDEVDTERETKEQEVERFLDQKQHLLEKIAQLELEAGAEEFEPYSDKDRDRLAVIAEGADRAKK